VPVQRFRTLDDARRALVVAWPGASLINRIRRVWATAALLAPAIEIPRGVRKFRTIEDCNQERNAREQARVDKARARRS
jgi:hypothetical protein